MNRGSVTLYDESVSSMTQPADAIPVRVITRTDCRKSMVVIGLVGLRKGLGVLV